MLRRSVLGGAAVLHVAKYSMVHRKSQRIVEHTLLSINPMVLDQFIPLVAPLEFLILWMDLRKNEKLDWYRMIICSSCSATSLKQASNYRLINFIRGATYNDSWMVGEAVVNISSHSKFSIGMLV